MLRRLSAAFGPGVLAGLAGGILIDAYLLAVGAFTHTLTPSQHYTYIASAFVGKAAYAFPGMEWLGVLIHFIVSIGWGIGYAYTALTSPQLVTRPVVSGIAFGVFVYIVMQIVTASIGIWRPPSAGSVFTGLIAHVVFFGLPVAYVVARRLRVA